MTKLKWDEDFSPEKTRMVTLKDEEGTLYRVQASLLAAQSSFFRDMFACATFTEKPIEADLSKDWTKELLKCISLPFLRSEDDDEDKEDGDDDDEDGDGDGGGHSLKTLQEILDQVSSNDLPSLYVWCQKYEFGKLRKIVWQNIERRIQQDLATKYDWPDGLLALFRIAGQKDDIRLAKLACSFLFPFEWGSVVACDEITEHLPSHWRLPFVESVLYVCMDDEVDHPIAPGVFGNEFENRIKASGLRSSDTRLTIREPLRRKLIAP